MKVVEFRPPAPSSSCPYCGHEKPHPDFTCPRIRSVTHHAPDGHQEFGAITLCFVDDPDDDLVMHLELDDEDS